MTGSKRVAAGIVALAAGCSGANASITWSGWVNGFGVGRLTYSATDGGGTNSGSFITVGSNVIQSPNGANQKRITYYPLWGYTEETLSSKSGGPAMTATLNNGNLSGDGVYTNSGSAYSPTPGETYEIALLAIDGSLLPTDNTPRSVSQLVGEGYITASQVLYTSGDGPGSFNDPISIVHEFSEPQDEESYVLYSYSSAVPAPAGAGALLLAGLVVRRRR